MPECWYCRKMQPSAEVRKTPRGWKCKDRLSCEKRKNAGMWDLTLPKKRNELQKGRRR